MSQQWDDVYDMTKKDQKDKYAVYFGGNYGEVDIKVKNPDNDRTLLIVKDSFANSMVPFLMKDYAQIRMIDLRYFKKSVKKYLEENPADEVLVLYEMGLRTPAFGTGKSKSSGRKGHPCNGYERSQRQTVRFLSESKRKHRTAAIFPGKSGCTPQYLTACLTD